MGMRQLKMQPLRDPDIKLVEAATQQRAFKSQLPYSGSLGIYFREGLGKTIRLKQKWTCYKLG